MSFEGQPELKLFSPAHCVKARGAGASVVAHERACVRWLCVRCAARVMRLCHPAGGHCSKRRRRAGWARGLSGARARARAGREVGRAAAARGAAARHRRPLRARRQRAAVCGGAARRRRAGAPRAAALAIAGRRVAAASLLVGLRCRPGRFACASGALLGLSQHRRRAGRPASRVPVHGGDMKRAQAAVMPSCVRIEALQRPPRPQGVAGRARGGFTLTLTPPWRR